MIVTRELQQDFKTYPREQATFQDNSLPEWINKALTKT